MTGPIVITPDGRTAYAVSEPGDAVIPINLVTRKAGPPIPVGTFPYSLALTPDGKTLYAAGRAGEVPHLDRHQHGRDTHPHRGWCRRHGHGRHP